MKIFLRDRNPGMISAWKKHFSECNDVDISLGDIFEGFNHKVDAIVSPANSFGFMDGGIDYVYSMKFGWEMSERLRKEILAIYGGELLVGSAHVIETGSEDIPWLICAPTMRVPMDVSDTVNAFLAFRAALYAVNLHNWRAENKDKELQKIESILCPGLGTAVGEMPYTICAQQMHIAYRHCIQKNIPVYENLGDAYRVHYMMVGAMGQTPQTAIKLAIPKTDDEA